MRSGDDPNNTVEEGIVIGLEFGVGRNRFIGIQPRPPHRQLRSGNYGNKRNGQDNLGFHWHPILLHKHGEKPVQIPTNKNDGLHDEMVAFVESIRTGAPPEADSHAGASRGCHRDGGSRVG